MPMLRKFQASSQKLRKATMNLVMSSCQSVRPSVRMELGSDLRMFMKFYIFGKLTPWP